jgi:hypothetical protein
MSEPFSLIKMLSSPFTGMYWIKCTMIGLGIFMIAFTGYGLYKAYVKKPEATTTQRAETIINYNNQPRVTFGCASWKVREYLTNKEK